MARRISEEDNRALLKEFTATEVREAVFSMKAEKSPGPDGFNPGTNCFPIGFNDANITLIPKVNFLETVGDLRPIALCNVITDNILIASEVLHYMNHKKSGKVGWAALKLDMAKAYDRLEWNFLEMIMLKLGFDVQWIQLIMTCVTTVRYRIVVNGKLTKLIVPSRGIRQGDPLSPYLFILCAEGLSYLLQNQEIQGNIHGCKVARGAPSISHIFFADDSLLFFRAEVRESEAIKNCLNTYEATSGQAVNLNKSCICFSRNTQDLIKESITGCIGIVNVVGLGKYLGLPLGIGRNKQGIFSYIEAKIKQRISGWNKRILSRAGKEVLLKSIAQAMPTFTMSIYLLPKTLCSNLENTLNKFWWQNKESDIHWLSWEKMCSPKSSEGLGFKRRHIFNIALLVKQGWRLITNPDSLVSKIFKARYFPQGNFLQAVIGSNPSYCWRSILAAQDILIRGCGIRIGDGKSTNIFNHPWLPDTTNPFVTTNFADSQVFDRVAELIDPATSDWNIQLINEYFNSRDVRLISQIPVSMNHSDQWFWMKDLKGLYSVRNGYRELYGEAMQPDSCNFKSWNQLWRLKIPPKIKNFIWRCARNILPVKTVLRKEESKFPLIVPFVTKKWSPRSHLFLDCEFSKLVWDNTILPLHILEASFESWLSQVVDLDDENKSRSIIAILWTVWKNRNEYVWNNKQWNTVQRTQGIDASWVYCEVDASVIENSASFGAVIRTHSGLFLAAISGPLRLVNEARLAEALAIKEALSWLKSKQWQKICILTDCQQAFSISYINRSGNVCAHTLARVAPMEHKRPAGTAAWSGVRGGHTVAEGEVMIQKGLQDPKVKFLREQLEKVDCKIIDNFFKSVRCNTLMSGFFCPKSNDSTLLTEVNRKNWKPVVVSRGGTGVSRLFFADDLMLFAKASEAQGQVIMDCLDTFSKQSGVKRDLKRTMGILVSENLGNYLGVPILQQRVTKQTFTYILEGMKKKLANWKAETLSLAGRKVLIQSVLATLPVYSMQAFKLPVGIS
ncbi:uncharacterized protein LOC116010798 [Ipomoea triloba]|uniref:uncharacterized protein LOC116010798 n=1 Tax=Ipomoea triloba TaxID=35885 RepID=UPI00125D0CF4|nr:uncharacterized protein LOC116010798 [Ipomoea triloba]